MGQIQNKWQKMAIYISVLVSLLMSLSSSLVLAQTKPLTASGGFGLVAPIVAQPGQYDIQQRDVSLLLQEALKRAGEVQESDRRYLDQTVESLRLASNQYIQLLLVGEFKKLSDISVAGQTVPVLKFLETLNQVRGSRAALINQLQILDGLQSALPSDISIPDGKNSLNLPQARKINFSAISTKIFEQVHKAEFLANNYPFVIEHTAGLQIIPNQSGSALNPVLQFPLLTGSQIAELQKKARRLSTPDAEFERSAESHGNLLKRLISVFVNQYGRMEAYRFRDAELARARADQFEQIVNAFWMRSYLRQVYGVRVGALLPANYKKRWMNTDLILVLTEQLTQFSELTGPSQINDSDLMKAMEDIRMYLSVLGQRTEKILVGDASVIARLNSFITLMKGERPTAEALLMIMQLVAADIKEEQILATGFGLDSLVTFYQSRWKSTPQDIEINKKRVCAFDHLFNLQTNASQCYQGNPESGVKGVFVKMNDSLNAMSADIENANKIRHQIHLQMMLQSRSESGAPGSRRGG